MNINFTKSEAHALHNITSILIGYMNAQVNTIQTKEQYVYAKVLVDVHQALDNGETQFDFSPNIKEFLIDTIEFWYKGVGAAIKNSNKLQGRPKQMFIKHYNLVPFIIKKINQYETKDLQTAAR